MRMMKQLMDGIKEQKLAAWAQLTKQFPTWKYTPAEKQERKQKKEKWHLNRELHMKRRKMRLTKLLVFVFVKKQAGGKHLSKEW